MRSMPGAADTKAGCSMTDTSLDALLDVIVDRLADAVAVRLEAKQDKPAERDGLVDEPAMADLAGVSPQTLQRQRKAGEVPFVRMGRRVLYRPADVFAALTTTDGEVQR